MKKIMSFLVIFALMASMLVSTAFAAGTVISVDDVSANAGEEVTVNVNISGNTGFAAAKVQLVYDSSVLTLKSITTGLLAGGAVNNEKGLVTFASATEVTDNGVLMSATFIVAEDAPDGVASVSVNVSRLANTASVSLNPTVSAGGVSVKANHTHSYTKVVTAPTCTEKGYTTYTCACGDSYKDDEVAALGHKWDDGVVTTEPTETATGVRTYTCATCGETKTEVIPMLDHTHNYTKVVTAPTCTEKGYTTYTCACGDSYKDDYKDALGHKWDDGVVTTEPTEEAAGVRTYTCATCGETKTEVIPALDHTHKYTTEVTAPTCTEKGYTTYTCACGDSYKADEVAALGHKYTTEVTAPTCTEAGYTTYTCSVCGDTYKSDEVAAKGHKYTAPTFAWSEDNAACTVSYSCGECGESFTKDAVVTVKDDSTCTVAGTITYTAAVEIDGESYSDVKTAAGAVLPHEYEITCTWKEDNTVAGVKMVCKSCGDAHEVAGEEVTVSEEKKANGEIVHIASFVVNGQTYSVTKVIPAPETADTAMLGLYGTMLLMAAAALVVLKKKSA